MRANRVVDRGGQSKRHCRYPGWAANIGVSPMLASASMVAGPTTPRNLPSSRAYQGDEGAGTEVGLVEHLG